MSRDFLSNFEPPKTTKSEFTDTAQSYAPDKEDLEYSESDYVRNLYLVWPDGHRHFINYNRLDSGSVDEAQQQLRFNFGNEVVELLGIRLLPLFNSISTHKRKYVYCDDERYNELDNCMPTVNEINIIQNS